MTNFDDEYFESALSPLGVKLDIEQREAILCDAPYTLIIAAAGSGKTTTMIGKIKYLVDASLARPNEILVISFTNKAVEEFREKLNKIGGLKQCSVKTFHKLGYQLCNQNEPAAPNIVDGAKQSAFVLNTFNELIQDKSFAEKILLFFGSYFGYPFEDIRENERNSYFIDTQTLRTSVDENIARDIDNLGRQRISIQYEYLRSKEEVQIANFLYLHKIDYEYEKPYPNPVGRYSRPYLPDFTLKLGDKEVYLEHFGISEDHKSDRYSEENLRKYVEAIEQKEKRHKEHNTTLLSTYSTYLDERPLLDHLKELLTDAGFKLEERDSIEVCQSLVTAKVNLRFKRFTDLITRFIIQFKAKQYTEEQFTIWLDQYQQNPRHHLFLEICQKCYHAYQKELNKAHLVDFEDMINNTHRALDELKQSTHQSRYRRNRYKYILIDEYQDISMNRLDFVKTLSDYYKAKIVAVGDDWQTIFGYAGADDKLFADFEKFFKGAQIKHINTTYRNSQQLNNIAGDFVQHSSHVQTKYLRSSKSIPKPVYLHVYDERSKDYATTKQEVFGKNVVSVLKRIKQDNPDADWSKQKILLLGRYSFERENLIKSELFDYVSSSNQQKLKVKDDKELEALRLEFLTIHKAKGTTYDHVVILNAQNAIYGFPCGVMTEPILQLVTNSNPEQISAEERRLFYVALTRTKNKVYILVPKQNPSKFITEIYHQSKRYIERNGIWEDTVENEKKVCPYCNSQLQYRSTKAVGFPLYVCTNAPELCGFMTNNIRGGKLSIMNCYSCSGYLVVRERNGDYFLGCTNYGNPKTKCTCQISNDFYMNYYALDFTPEKYDELLLPY